MFKIHSHFLYSTEKHKKLSHITFYITVADQCSIISTLCLDNAAYAVSKNISDFFVSLENIHGTEKRLDFFRLMDTIRVVFFNKIVSSPDFI